KLLQDRRAADHDFGLAGGEGGVESGDRGTGPDVELEAVLGVEAARLHDVPHERVEYRKRQARNGDLRSLLRRRAARSEQRKEASGRQGCQAATEKYRHGVSFLRFRAWGPRSLQSSRGEKVLTRYRIDADQSAGITAAKPA